MEHIKIYKELGQKFTITKNENSKFVGFTALKLGRAIQIFLVSSLGL